jgi:hypothetical protein
MNQNETKWNKMKQKWNKMKQKWNKMKQKWNKWNKNETKMKQNLNSKPKWASGPPPGPRGAKGFGNHFFCKRFFCKRWLLLSTTICRHLRLCILLSFTDGGCFPSFLGNHWMHTN